MSNSFVHPMDDAGERLCCVQDSPTAPAPTIPDDNCDVDVRHCPSCARPLPIPIIRSVQARCDGAPLLDTILALTVTPPDEESAVMLILCPALVELAVYVGKSGGAR